MTLEELHRFRDHLSPLAAGDPPPDQHAAFLGFYHLDFSREFPGLEYRVGSVPSGTFQLAAHCWRQPDATANLLIVHGYMDHTGLFGKLIRFGLEHRCNVVIFDLPGHGLSSGEAITIDDFGQYGDAVASVLAACGLPDHRWLALAQSTGGAALLEYARRYDWHFAGAALLAPLVRPAGWLQMKWSSRLLQAFVDEVPRRFSTNSADDDFLAFQQADPLSVRRIPLSWIGALDRWLASLAVADLGVGPVLVVQGMADATVDWAWNLPCYLRFFPGSDTLMVPGAGHQLANEAEAIQAQFLPEVADWLGVSAN